MRVNTIILLLILTCAPVLHAQIENYDFKRELQGITGQWHKVVLPDDMFGKLSPGMSDIRIYGTTAEGEPVEVPYLLQRKTEESTIVEADFTLLNQSRDEKGFYYTFEVPEEIAINRMHLDFEQRNFDWQLTIAGSHNQQQWFTLAENHRILSIKNENVDYRYSDVSFPYSNYRYFRLFIPAAAQPELTSATLSRTEVIAGENREYGVARMETREESEQKQTTIKVNLEHPVPVSFLQITVRDTLDFYRPVTVEALTDSIETEVGWRYSYTRLASGILRSAGQNQFRFPVSDTMVQKLRIRIYNGDNRPLTPDHVAVEGPEHHLLIRFFPGYADATWYLVYGSRKAGRADYDLRHFADSAPEKIPALALGAEQQIDKKDSPGMDPLFKNKAWLWVVMILIIVVLGGFSVKMLRNS